MRPETVENYLKTIYNLSVEGKSAVGNFKLADKLGIRPASVTEGLRKLHELKYVVYEKSYGTRLTAQGARLALNIIRRHRIWETYLVKELGFGWDEVHEIAEELEHVRNDKLINKLSELLGNPVYDPHGDPIPDEQGKIKKGNFIQLSEGKKDILYTLRGVSEHSTEFLRYLAKNGITIGSIIKIMSVETFDASLKIKCNRKEIVLSSKASQNLIVE